MINILRMTLRPEDDAGCRATTGTVKIKKALFVSRQVGCQIIEDTPQFLLENGSVIGVIEAAPAKANPMLAVWAAINAATSHAIAKNPHHQANRERPPEVSYWSMILLFIFLAAASRQLHSNIISLYAPLIDQQSAISQVGAFPPNSHLCDFARLPAEFGSWMRLRRPISKPCSLIISPLSAKA